MKKFHSLALAGALLVAGTAYATTRIVRAQDKGQGGAMDAMLAEMMKLAAPGAQHEQLTSKAGEWEQTYRMRMDADSPWTDTTGSAVAKPVLGGRYLLEQSEMNMMGMSEQGMHLLGFDNRTQEYISLWADSWSTWWTTSKGKEIEKGVIETEGMMNDARGEHPFRMLIHYREDGSIYSEMFDTSASGEFKVMEITAKRKP